MNIEENIPEYETIKVFRNGWKALIHLSGKYLDIEHDKKSGREIFHITCYNNNIWDCSLKRRLPKNIIKWLDKNCFIGVKENWKIKKVF